MENTIGAIDIGKTEVSVRWIISTMKFVEPLQRCVNKLIVAHNETFLGSLVVNRHLEIKLFQKKGTLKPGVVFQRIVSCRKDRVWL